MKLLDELFGFYPDTTRTEKRYFAPGIYKDHALFLYNRIESKVVFDDDSYHIQLSRTRGIKIVIIFYDDHTIVMLTRDRIINNDVSEKYTKTRSYTKSKFTRDGDVYIRFMKTYYDCDFEIIERELRIK